MAALTIITFCIHTPMAYFRQGFSDKPRVHTKHFQTPFHRDSVFCTYCVGDAKIPIFHTFELSNTAVAQAPAETSLSVAL